MIKANSAGSFVDFSGITHFPGC